MERIASESQSRREPRVGNTMIDQWVLGTGICGMGYRYPGCYFEGDEKLSSSCNGPSRFHLRRRFWHGLLSVPGLLSNLGSESLESTFALRK
jgi:hypothetical protein